MIAVLAAQAITAVVCGFAVWTLRRALVDQATVFDRIEQRAHVERHTLAGRLQRPDLFPTAPIPVPNAPDQLDEGEPAEATSDAAAFEAAGRDLDGLPERQLAAIFGEDLARELTHG